MRFPVVNGIPILLPSHSVFSAPDVASDRETFFNHTENRWKRTLRKKLPRLTGNPARTRIYAHIESLIRSLPAPARGLQIGAGETAAIMNRRFNAVEWLHTDVDLLGKPHLVADVTGLPVPDESFDIVFADNVLEHVIDIGQAARELQRVLRVGGVIVAGIPFVYPFHGVPYDFYRVTPCGIRALFSQTELLHIHRGSGAWSALGLLLSTRMVEAFQQRQARMAAGVVSRLLFAWMKYLDGTTNGIANMTSCAGVVYIGRKTPRTFTPREMMNELRQLFG
jgi:ubiquinone/menaquinone biosynthesis C-methylase UbiE